MINQKESKKVRMGLWLLYYYQEKWKQKQKTMINRQTITKITGKIKNNWKIKSKGNITPIMHNYSRNG